MDKNIKLETIWISDNYSSESSKNSVYKTLGFYADVKKDRYSEKQNTLMYYDKNNILCILDKYSNDVKAFKTKHEAVQFAVDRKQYWIKWYKEQIADYTKRIQEAFK